MAAVSRIHRTFRDPAVHPDDQFLDANADFAAVSISGSGMPRSDLHTDHAGGQVIDMSNSGSARWLYTADTMDDDDHASEIGHFFDSYSSNNNTYSGGGAIVRGQNATVSSFSGYEGRVYMSNGSTGPRRANWEINKVTAGTSTTLLSGTLDSTVEAEFMGGNRIRLDATGTTLTLSLNGIELGSTTDSTYTTGSYVGGRQDRQEASSNSQPFVFEFNAWSVNETNPVFADAVVTHTSDRLVGTDTDGVTTVEAAANDMLFVFSYFEDGGSANQAVTVSDDGTGTWTNEFNEFDGGEFTEINVWSKTADGTETAVTVDTVGDGTRGHAVLVLPEGWAWAADAVDFDLGGSPTTGTLSSKPKIGVLMHVTGTARDVSFLDGEYDFEIGRQANHGPGGSEHRWNVGFVDLGTATTAFGGNIFEGSSNSMMMVGVLEYTAAVGPTPDTYQLKEYVGAAWTGRPIKAWNGSAWAEGTFTELT